MNEASASDDTLKKRWVGGGTSFFDGLRRTFFSILRHPQPSLSSQNEPVQRQNMSLSRFIRSENEPNQILVTKRRLPNSNSYLLHQCGVRRFSAYTETPEAVCTEFIHLDKLSGGSGKPLPHNMLENRRNQHAFCAIPLELDTFCDYCNHPIWGLGWGPVCQRCADCHLTCHWLCKERVTIPCEMVHVTNEDYGSEVSDSDSSAKNSSKKADTRTPIISRSSSQESPRSRQASTTVGRELNAVSVSMYGDYKESTLTNADCGRTRVHNSPATARPYSQFSLFVSTDANLNEDHIPLRDEKKEQGEGQQLQVEAQDKLQTSHRRTILHQSMLQSRRRPHRDCLSSDLSSRRHTTALTLTTTTATDIYDISSLDQRDIRERGISVWHLSPAAAVDNSASPSVVMSSLMQATQIAAITGHQTGAEEITYKKVTIGPRNASLPWNPVELARRLDIFNANDFGLCAKMTPKLPPGDCEGQVRVHINLIRPVRMVLSTRPASIFDIVGGGDSDDDGEDNDNSFQAIVSSEMGSSVGSPLKSTSQTTSFRLPRGSSKLLHVHLSTTASKVIGGLLARFNIDDNPQKFALYEHTIFGENEVTVRKLFDDESPLGLLLQWTLDPSSTKVGGKSGETLNKENFNALLAVKRIVLQENETGDIEWSCFSEAELRTFLVILNREEADYRRRIELKYQIRKREILRLMNLRAKYQQDINTVSATPLIVNDDGNSPTIATPPFSYGDVLRLDESNEEKNRIQRGVFSNDISPLPAGVLLTSANSITPSNQETVVDGSNSPSKISHTQVLTKTQQKHRVNLRKGKGKKISGVKESGMKPTKPKSRMWLKRKK